MSKPVKSVNNRIIEALKLREMTQKDLSDKTGISEASISQYVNGRATPKNDGLYLIAQALHVTEPWLLGYDVEINQTNNGTIAGHNSGTISNVGATTSHSGDSTNTDSNNTYTTNNYYSSPCEHRVNHQIEATIHSKELFFTIIDYLRDMTDEQLKDTIKYIEFLLKG